MTAMHVVTFRPPQGCRGEDGPAYQGNFRKGELRGIIRINKANCVGCDTCSKFCPVNAISGGLGSLHSIRDDACVSCGQCLTACPFGAIEQMSFVDDVLAKLADPKKFVVAHPSPAVRVALTEEFGAKPGELCTEQLLNALEKAGFHVYDVNQTADQTILEEGTEFIKKLRYWVLNERSDEVNMMAKHPLPHFTSCCPGWVRNMEINFASAIPHVSTTKSPIQMGGALAKSWAAKHVWKKDPRDVVMVSVSPCTAKIFEASRPEFVDAWRWNIEHGELPKDTPAFPDIDYALTTRDIAEVFRRKGINPLDMPKTYETKTMGKYTGAGTIFGASGGVMEAALRSAYFLLSGEELKDPNIISVRGLNKALVEATIPIPVKANGGKIFELRVAVVNGALQELNHVMRIINEDKNRWHFIEVMNCPGGCVNGGGQPLQGAGSAWLRSSQPLPLRL
jgi:ferredoxin hydrogenase large subunit